TRPTTCSLPTGMSPTFAPWTRWRRSTTCRSGATSGSSSSPERKALMPKQKASTVGFWFAFSVCLVCVSGVRAADPEPEARVDLLGVVRAYADAMLEHGRDHWGQPSPLFASLLNRETHDLFNFEPADVDPGYVRAKVPSERWPALFPADQARDERMFDASNPAHDEHLFSVLYQLSEVLGDAKYAQAADAAISYWVLN